MTQRHQKGKTRPSLALKALRVVRNAFFQLGSILGIFFCAFVLSNGGTVFRYHVSFFGSFLSPYSASTDKSEPSAILEYIV